MNKKYIALLSAMLILLPSGIFAQELPRFRNPNLPPLEVPQLSKTYEEMKAELEKQGLGVRRYDPTQPIPMPDVEAPEGTGKDAMQKFYERFGDMWNDPMRQLDTESRMPDESFFTRHNLGLEQAFKDAKNRDAEALKEAMAETLDMSILWDLDKVKADMTKFDDAELQAYLDGAEKPADYEKYKEIIEERLNRRNSPSALGLPGQTQDEPQSPEMQTAWERVSEGAINLGVAGGNWLKDNVPGLRAINDFVMNRNEDGRNQEREKLNTVLSQGNEMLKQTEGAKPTFVAGRWVDRGEEAGMLGTVMNMLDRNRDETNLGTFTRDIPQGKITYRFVKENNRIVAVPYRFSERIGVMSLGLSNPTPEQMASDEAFEGFIEERKSIIESRR